MRKKRLLNSFITVGRYYEFLDHLVYLAQHKISSYTCVSNVHMLIEAYKDPNFNLILNNADVATPDGMPLAKCLKLFYKLKQDRVAGMDLFPSIMEKAQEKGLSVYFYGSTDEILNQISKKVENEFPSLNIAGFYSPPFRNLVSAENDKIVEMINKQEPNFIFVSLGCPKQEKWMAENKGKIKACMIGVGGAFPVYAGTQKRAPYWMQYYSLEWIYRLLQEPGRLWRRYLYTNSLFIILILRFYLKALFIEKTIFQKEI